MIVQSKSERGAILVVDDENANLLAMEAALNPLDLRIVLASGAAEAMELVKDDVFRLILLDVRMPGIDGFEAACMFRALEQTRTTPILFVSPMDPEPEQLLRAYRCGASDVVTKPFVPEILRAKVKALVDVSQQAPIYRGGTKETIPARAGLPVTRNLPVARGFHAVLDPNGVLLEVTPAGLDDAGFRREEVVGKPLWQVPWWDGSLDVQAAIRHVLTDAAGGRPHRDRTVYFASDGTPRVADRSILPVRDDEGRTLRLLVEMRDVTEDARNAELSQRLFENSCDCVTVTDLNGRILAVNSPGLRLLEAESSATIEGSSWPEFWIGAEERAAAEDAVRKGGAGGTSRFQGTFPTTKGTLKLWDVQVSPILDFLGCVERLMIVARDITDLHRANELIQEREEWFEATIKGIGDAVIATDSFGCIEFMNPVAEALTGWRQAEAMGQHVGDVFRISDETTRQMVESPVMEVLRSGTGKRLVNRTILTDRSGLEHHIDDSAAPVYRPDGSLQGVVLVFRDISERRSLEQVSEERIRSLTLQFAISDSLTGSDADDHRFHICCELLIEHLGAAFARIWLLDECDNSLVLRASAGMYTDLNGPHSRVAIGSHVVGLIAQERRGYVTNSVVTDSRVGDQEWAEREGMVSFSGFPLIVKDTLLGVVAVFAREPQSETMLKAVEAAAGVISLDIVRRQAEAKLQALNLELVSTRDQAVEASAAKSTFLAATSHELRTPLNAIIGYAEMVREELVGDDMRALEADVAKIEDAGRHLLALINGILDLSKIEAGKMEIFAEEFGLKSLVDEVIDTLQPVAVKAENRLEPKCGTACGLMVSDQMKVRQILLNLLSNALKFTRGGLVTLAIERTTAEGQDWIYFTVTDTGIGMTSEQMGLLFSDFTQVDSSSTRQYGGTGLGLAISQRFCKMLGGEISVSSEVNMGSVFTARLPANINTARQAGGEPAGSEIQRAGPAALRSEGKGVVLAIEDDVAMHDLLGRMLADAGLSLVSAFTGKQGLEMAKRLKPDLITLDIVMRGMDGWSVLSALKADPEVSDIPVVVLSISDDRRLGFTLGASEFLVKPVQRERLLRILSRYNLNPEVHRVLVVEEDPGVRELVEQTLQPTGYSVTYAENGREAVKALDDMTPDLIIIDLMMHTMDGIELLEHLRLSDRLHEVPVIVLTASEMGVEQQLRLKESVDSVFQKGLYKKEDLLKAICALAEQHRSGAKPDVKSWLIRHVADREPE